MEQDGRRSFKRATIALSVAFRPIGHTKNDTVQAENVSVGGLCLRTDKVFPFGTELDLEFWLPARFTAVRCRAVVMWCRAGTPGEAGSVGVRLLNVTAADQRVLTLYVQSNLGT